MTNGAGSSGVPTVGEVEAHQPRARIELLGVPRLVVDQREPHMLERRDAALFALLALNGPMPRGRVVSLLWPDLPTRTAQTNLRQRLFRLKKRIGFEIAVSDAVIALADGVQHDLEPRQLSPYDLAPGAESTLLGSLDYEDCGELGEWVANARERWQGERRKQLARRAAELESEGHIADALAFAERLTQEAPAAEHAHRRVMRLHYRRGDRSAALAAFRHCREALVRELGAQPGPETIELAALIERSGALPPPVAAPTPVATLRPPRLIGRDAEWHAIEAAWQRGQTVLVLGEPGMGKSRLSADFAAAQQQPNLHRAHPGDPYMPYSLLARLLRGILERFGAVPLPWVVEELARLLPELGTQPAGKLEALRLRSAVAEAMRHWQSMGLSALVIDDLHFADAASLEWLLTWLDHDHNARPQVIVTTRSNEMPEALRGWLVKNDPARVCEVVLAPLGVDAIAALLESLSVPGLDCSAWAKALSRHTGGNPLFILETLKARLSNPSGASTAVPSLSAPAHIGKMLERRLDQLAPEALRLARIAALAGTDFSVELAALVLGCHALDLAEAWVALEQAQIIFDGAFAHDLILEMTRRSVPPTIAIAMHRAIAQALEESAPAAPARIAHQWQQSKEWARAAPQFERTALAAQAAARPVEALAAWEAAASCHRAASVHDSEGRALQCDWQTVRKLVSTGDLTSALARADAMLSAANGRRQQTISLLARAQVLVENGDATGALANARRAGELATSDSDARLALLAAHQEAAALMRLAHATDAIALRDSHSHEMHLLDDEERLDWLDIYATALDYADRRSEALEVFNEAIVQAGAIGRWDLANSLGNNRAISLMYLNRLQASTDAVRAAIEHGRRAGLEPAGLVLEEMALAGNLRDLGQFTDSLKIAETLPQRMRDAGHAAWACNAENDLAGTYAWLGRHDLALKTLSPMNDAMPPMLRAMRLFVQARLLRIRPDSSAGERPGQLVRQAQAVIESAGGTGRSYVRLRVALELARDLGPDEAIAQVAVIEGEAMEREQFMLAMHALLLRTEFLLRHGAMESAATAARELVIRCERDGATAGLYTPEIWWVAHRALVDADPGAADACLHTAAQWIERVAQQHVPALYHQSFLARNPVNAAVRAAATRQRQMQR